MIAMPVSIGQEEKTKPSVGWVGGGGGGGRSKLHTIVVIRVQKTGDNS